MGLIGRILFVFLLSISYFSSIAQNGDVEMLVDTSYQFTNEAFDFGDGVKLSPPAYFLPFVQNEKQGFIHQGAASTIQVQIYEKVLYSYIAASLTEEELLKQNARLVEHSKVLTNDDKEADFFVIAFTLNSDGKEVEYERMMLLTGDHTKAIWINANYPVLAKQILFNVLKESLLTVQF